MPILQNLITGLGRASKFQKNVMKSTPMSSKRGNKNFYKGKGSRVEGHTNTKGHFFVNKRKALEIIVPDLEGFELKPYVQKFAAKQNPAKST